ncbi:BrnT family toxin [Exilibacterium tricleocarpae]|uniref:BrnT family toxin n=1 Tax=Exilibacterium tricleocarpae TaxID=2591008 RepID=A0A545TYY2_9GAMM|nr:BrnT family toxin [Exilibacterium tricleocarpae]TQV82428.1 BrnT family toxin [Exilibacterium tricleocarpae]
MGFEWDAAKNAVNIRKHGIDFADVEDIFNHPILTLPDNRDDYGEERWVAIGWVHTLMGVVVYTERRDDVIRIISARKATKYEVRRYEQNLKN